MNGGKSRLSKLDVQPRLPNKAKPHNENRTMMRLAFQKSLSWILLEWKALQCSVCLRSPSTRSGGQRGIQIIVRYAELLGACGVPSLPRRAAP